MFRFADYRYNNNQPQQLSPKIVGYFSLDSNKSFHQDASQLKYFYPSSIESENKIDLNDGDEFTRKTDSIEKKLDPMLRWVKKNAEKIRPDPNDSKWIRPDFVASRGTITKMMKANYLFKEGWTIYAGKYRGTIYLRTIDNYRTMELKDMNETQKKLMAWGLKFPSFLLSDDPMDPPDPSRPVDENETFSCIFESDLNNKKLLYEAIMDGASSKEKFVEPLPLEGLEFVEFKTSKIMTSHYQIKTMEKLKFLNWWCSNYVVGIENIICGFRNDDGIVEEIKEYKVSDLGNDFRHYWKKERCLDVMNKILQFIQDNVEEDYDKLIYKFQRFSVKYADDCQNNIKMTRIPATEEDPFLPDWFTA